MYEKEAHHTVRFLNPRALVFLLLLHRRYRSGSGRDTLLAFSRSETRTSVSKKTLTFAERVAYQRAIEDVYWRHRIWPKERPDSKPSLDAVMSQAQVEEKVQAYLDDSQTLEDHWQRPITADQLQTEMNRMARDTKQPEVLRELFHALGDDPAVIAECLARPVLAERSIADLSVRNTTGRSRSRRTDGLRTMPVARTFVQVAYIVPKIANADGPHALVIRGLLLAPPMRRQLDTHTQRSGLAAK